MILYNLYSLNFFPILIFLQLLQVLRRTKCLHGLKETRFSYIRIQIGNKIILYEVIRKLHRQKNEENLKLLIFHNLLNSNQCQLTFSCPEFDYARNYVFCSFEDS